MYVCVCEREYACVCVREREYVCVCVCVRERERYLETLGLGGPAADLVEHRELSLHPLRLGFTLYRVTSLINAPP